MRENMGLYRGKRTDNGEWVEGFFFAVDDDTYIQVLAIAIDGEREFECYQVDPDTVGQYTGQTDKNNKKIFEGDIWDCRGCTGVITWEEKVCSFEAVYKMYGLEYTNAVTDIRAKTVEVIGNIHDNPELLNT